MSDDPNNPASGESPRPQDEPQPAQRIEPAGATPTGGYQPRYEPRYEPQSQQPAYPAPAPPRRSWGASCLRTFLMMMGVFALLTIGLSFFVAYLFRDLSGPKRPIPIGDRIGLIRLEGMIIQGEDLEFLRDSLEKLGDNSRVKGIVIRINSPGGTVGASQEMYEIIAKLRAEKKKPVYISMGDVAASGGYYIASAADRIYAMRGTLTGSIGVIATIPQIGELTKKIGVETQTIKSGRFKDSGTITRPMTEPERQMFNFLIQDTYKQFTTDILRFRRPKIEEAMRKLPPEAWTELQFNRPAEAPTVESFLAEVADGRIYTGEQALRLGLIDEIGTLDDTIQALGRKVGLPGKPEVEERERHKGLSELFKTQVGNVLPSSQATLQYLMTLP